MVITSLLSALLARGAAFDMPLVNKSASAGLVFSSRIDYTAVGAVLADVLLDNTADLVGQQLIKDKRIVVMFQP